MLRSTSRIVFWGLALLGRRAGGIPPRRITNWFAKYGFKNQQPQSSDYRWIRDCWGNHLFLHPYYVIDRSVIANGSYDSDLHRWIHANISKGDVCFDVGANIGCVSTHLARQVGDEGMVYCFEPVPRINQLLRMNLEKNHFQRQTRIIPKALADLTGVATFNVVSDFGPNQGMGSLVSRNDSELKVQVETLDNFCEGEPMTRIDFIKLDIQGAEPLFLKGAQKTIRKFRPIFAFEISPEELKDAKSSAGELVSTFLDLEYTVRKLTSKGTVGDEIRKEELTPSYFASNVLAFPR